MFEYLGAGILVISAWLISCTLIHEHTTALNELEALYDMIFYIRDNIEHLMKPIPDIFREYKNHFLETCGFLSEVRSKDLRAAWETQTFHISGETKQLLEHFIKNIGNGYRKEELRLCDYTLERLRKLLDRTRSDTINQLKLYKTVPMMLALSVILILI